MGNPADEIVKKHIKKKQTASSASKSTASGSGRKSDGYVSAADNLVKSMYTKKGTIYKAKEKEIAKWEGEEERRKQEEAAARELALQSLNSHLNSTYNAPRAGAAMARDAVNRGLLNSGMSFASEPKEQKPPNNQYAMSQQKTALSRERARLDDLWQDIDVSDTRAQDDWIKRSNAVDDALRRLESEMKAADNRAAIGQFEKVRGNADFEEYAQKGAEMVNPTVKQAQGIISTPWGNIGGKDITNKVTYGRDNAGELQLGANTRSADAKYAVYQNMTDDEVAVYNYLLTTDPNRAEEYLMKLDPELQRRESDRRMGVTEDIAQIAPISASAATVFASPVKGAAYAGAMADTIMGNDINTDTKAYRTAREMDAMRGTVGGNINEDVQGATGSRFLGNASEFLYQVGLSMADSLVNTAITGGNAALAAGLMGGSAASSAMIDAKERGGNDAQALMVGGLAGIAEALFEKIPLERFVDTATSGVKVDALREILSQMGIEAGEEALTEISNIITEAVVMGEQSQYAGMSIWEQIAQVGMAALGGAISGAGMGGIAQVGNYATRKANERAAAAPVTEPAAGADPIREAAMQAAIAQEEQTEQPMEKAAPMRAAKPAEQTPVQEAQKRAESAPAMEGDNDTPELAAPTRAVTMTRRDNAVNTSYDEAVEVVGIDSVDDGKVYVLDSNDDVIALNDVDFSDSNTAALYRAAGSFDTATAQRFVQEYDGSDVQQYTQAFTSVYNDGKAGIDYNTTLTQRASAATLTESQRITAHAGGQKAASASLPNMPKKFTPGLTRAYTKASLTAEGRENTKKYRRQLQALDTIGKKYNREIVLVSSLKGMNIGGVTITGNVNGAYDPTTKRIYIAADAQDGAFAYVAMHELVHSIKDSDSKAYDRLHDVVFEALEASGEDTDALTKYQMDKFGYDEASAIEEVISNTAPTVLMDEQFVRDLYNNDRTLFDKIREFFEELKQVFAELTQSGSWAQDTALDEESVAKIAKVFDKVAMETADLSQEGVVTNADGEAVAYSDGNGGLRFSEKTYREGGRDTLVNYLDKQVESGEMSRVDADDIVSHTDQVYETMKKVGKGFYNYSNWAEAEVALDDNGDPVFSVVKANGDYAMNLDFSLVCKKRRTLDAVFNEMISRGIIDNFDLAQTEIVQINDIIRDYGFETACALCFVDAKRFRQAKVADDFVNMYNSAVRSMATGKQLIDSFNFGGDSTVRRTAHGIDKLPDDQLDFTKIDKTLAGGKKGTVAYKIAEHLKNHPEDRKLVARGDFMSSRGFDTIKKKNPAVLKLYNSKKGSGGPKAAFGDVQYLSDIIRDGKFKPEAAYAVGGVRVQSFSDYVPRLVFDYVQMIGDLAAKLLPAHSYTKEELFVKQFGLTGMKINMSLIPAVVDGAPAGLDTNGNYAWAKESFDYDTAVEIQNDPAYGRNCGTICVGVSDEHIRKLMADPNIRMVIPYHKSGLNPLVAQMNKIGKFGDYTNPQNTRYANGKKLSAADHANEPNFNERLHELGADGDPRAVVEEYVRWCEDNNYLPKFDKFAYVRENGKPVVGADGRKVVDPNYYKLIEDFTVYDGTGNYVPQGAVRAIYPDDGAAFGSMTDLIKRGLEEDQALEDMRSEKVGDIVDEIQQTLKPKGAPKFSVRDTDYMAAVNRGDMETAQKMVNEAAREALENGAEFKLADDDGVMAYKLHRGKAPRKTLIVYKTFNVDENGLPHATYAGTEDGMPYGVWLDAVAQPYVVGADGNKYIPGTTGTAPKMAGLKSPSAYGFKGYTSWLSYRPAFHASTIPAPLQMRIKNPATGEKTALPHNKLIFRVEVSADVDYQDAARAAGEAETERRKVYWRENAEYRAAKRENDVNEARKAAEKKGKPFDEEAWLKAYDAKGDKVIGAARDQLDSIPEMGVYRYRNQGEDWVLAGSFRVLGAVTEEEVRRVNDAHGYPNSGKSKMEWIGGYNPQEFGLTPLKDGENPPVGDPRYKSVKVADPVTYDDDGNVIPLSKRFNPESTDVRFSAKDTAQRERDARTAERIAEGRKQSAAQQKADSKLETQAGRYEAEIAKREAEITELKQRIKDERAAGQINTAIERKAGRQAVEDERLAARMAEGRVRAEERRKGSELVEAEKQKLRDYKQNERMRNTRDVITERVKTISNWITSPTDKRFVPESMQLEIGRFISAINMGFKEDSKVKERWMWRMDRMNAAVKATLKASPDNSTVDISEGTVELIEDFTEEIKNQGIDSIKQMSEKQLDTLADILGSLKKEVIDANKSFIAGRLQERTAFAEDTIARADRTKLEPKNNVRKAVLSNRLVTGNLKPPVFFRLMGGRMRELGEDLLNAERDYSKGMMAARDFYKALKEHYKTDDWLDVRKKDNVGTFELESGEKISLSRDQALNIYVLNLRERLDTETNHLRGGGITFRKDAYGKEVKGDEPHILTDADITAIRDWLTPSQLQFAHRLVSYMSTELSQLGNRTSLRLIGRRLFKGEHYVPFDVDKNHVKHETGKAGEVDQPQSARVKNKGMTKSTLRNASTPLVIDGLTDVFAAHVQEMCTYAAFAIPQDNILRVMNYKSTGTQTTVRSAMNAAYGNQLYNYLDALMADIGGKRSGSAMDTQAMKLISKFKAGSVLSSLSVAIQQPSSIARAFSVLKVRDARPPHFAKAGKAIVNKSFEEAMQYSGTAVIKDMGGFDISSRSGVEDWLLSNKPKGFKEHSDKVGTWLPEQLDKLTFGSLWEACKVEVARNNKGLEFGGEQHLLMTGERFDEVIRLTQVYDSTLSRSENMRTKTAYASMATAFMGEPTTAMNLLFDAMYNAKNKAMDGRIGVRKAAAAYVGTVVLNAALKSVVYAMRDDDEDQNYWEKYKEALGEALLGEKTNKLPNWLDSIVGFVAGSEFSPVGQVPILSDVSSIIGGYDVNRSDMDAISSLVSATMNLFSDKRTTYAKVRDMVGAVSVFTGIPVKNLWRDAEGLLRTVGVNVPATANSAASTAGAFEEAYKALADGNHKAYDKHMEKAEKLIRATLEKNIEEKGTEYTDIEQEVENRLVRGLRDALKEDERIKQMAEYRVNDWDYDGYMALYNELLDEGFPEAAIKGASNSAVSALEETNVVDSKPYNPQHWTKDDLQTAFEEAMATGDSSGIEAMMEEMRNYSGTYWQMIPQEADQVIKGAAKKAYEAISNDPNDKQAVDVLGLVDYTKDDAQGWANDSEREQMYSYLAAGDWQNVNAEIVVLKKSGVKAESIKSGITNKAKRSMKSAKESGDTEAYNKIIDALTKLNVYDAKGNRYYTRDRILGWDLD